jgi:serine/threonine protein kinase
MLLEHCDNGDLCDLTLKSKGISDLKLLKYLFKQVLGAVSALHELGMGHFDIKLENVLVANNF